MLCVAVGTLQSTGIHLLWHWLSRALLFDFLMAAASSAVPPILFADDTLLLSTSAAGLQAQLDLLAAGTTASR